MPYTFVGASNVVEREQFHNLTSPATGVGQLLVIVVGSRGGSNPSTPAGWTAIADVRDAEVQMFVRESAGDSSDDIVNFDFAGTGGSSQMLAFSGDIFTPLSGIVSAQAERRANVTGARVQDVTPLDDDCVCIYGLAKNKDSGQNNVTLTGVPAGYTDEGYWAGSGFTEVFNCGWQIAGSSGVLVPGGAFTFSLADWSGVSAELTVALKAGEPSGGPTITDTVPAQPHPGQTGVLINGSGFGASQGASTVTYGGLPVTVTGWSDTQITATWPAVNAPSSTLGFNTNHTLEVTVV